MQEIENLPEEVVKKLKSIERRQKKIANEIDELGYDVYLSSDNINIMDGDTHSDKGFPLHENVVWNIRLYGWSGGDW